MTLPSSFFMLLLKHPFKFSHFKIVFCCFFALQLLLFYAFKVDAKLKVDEINFQIAAENDCLVRSRLQLELAKKYFELQEHERAFETFLVALEGLPGMNHTPDPAEQVLYDEALALYLTGYGPSVKSVSGVLVEKYGTAVESGQFNQLRFLVASAYANLGQFPKFFDLFYASYAASPGHYLAHKVKAILHLKLFERSCPGPRKEIQRAAVIRNLQRAVEIFPLDISLYRLMILYADEKDKKKIIAASLNRIIDRNIVVSRGDLNFFIQNSMELADLSLSERFLHSANQWYPSSRVVTTAQQSIDRQKANLRRDNE